MAAIAVVGADGLIGRALALRLRERGHAVLATTRRRDEAERRGSLWLDLAAEEATWPNLACDAAVLCAATTSIAACEADPSASARVNAEAPAGLALRLMRAGTHVVALSSTAVFDGERGSYAPGDASSPVTAYGRQKAELERRLLDASTGRCAVVRLTKVLAPDGRLLAQWAGELQRGETVEAFEDAWMSPVALDRAVDLLVAVAERRAAGIVHYGARDEISYADAARRIAARAGSSIELVRGVPVPPGVRIARHASLNCDATAGELAEVPPSTEALDRFATPRDETQGAFAGIPGSG